MNLVMHIKVMDGYYHYDCRGKVPVMEKLRLDRELFRLWNLLAGTNLLGYVRIYPITWIRKEFESNDEWAFGRFRLSMARPEKPGEIVKGNLDHDEVSAFNLGAK